MIIYERQKGTYVTTQQYGLYIPQLPRAATLSTVQNPLTNGAGYVPTEWASYYQHLLHNISTK